MKNKKIIMVICSSIIGVISLLFIYFVLIFTGVISSRKTNLIIESKSYQGYYDGSIHNCEEYEIISGSLNKGEYIVCDFNSGIKNAGKVDNSFVCKVYDSNNYDVTSNYNIKSIYGMIEVLPREITIQTSSDSKIYDGTKLIGSAYKVTKGTLLNDNKLNVSFTSEITDVGVTYNVVTSKVTDKDNNDITFNYDISYTFGILEVTGRELVIQSKSRTKYYDGTPLVCEEYSVVRGELLDNDKIVASYDSKIVDAGVAPNVFEATILGEDGTDKTKYYDITYIYGNLAVNKMPIKIKTSNGTKVYDGTPLKNEEFEIVNPSDLVDGEKVQGVFTSELTYVGQTENQAQFYIVADGMKSENYEIEVIPGTLEVTKRFLTIESGSKSKSYDGTPLSYDYYEISSGSLAYGDQIDVKVNKEITNAGFEPNTFTCSIYNSNNKDVFSNYSINTLYGTLTIEATSIVVRSNDSQMIYDGNVLKNDDYTISYGALAEGDYIEVGDFKTLSYVGKMDNTFSCVVYNKFGKDNSINYNIVQNYGTLEILKREITISAKSQTKYYDGLELKTSNTDYTLIGSLANNDTLNVTYINSITEVGMVNNEFTYEINHFGNDAIECYNVKLNYGTLKVLAVNLDIITQSSSKIYDKTPLEQKNVILTGTIPSPLHIEYTFLNEIINVGSVKNECVAKIYDYENNDVTYNFNLRYTFGTLTIKKASIGLRSGSITQIFVPNADELKCETYEFLYGQTYIASNDSLRVYYSSSLSIPGEIDNEFYCYVIDVDGINVTENYDIEKKFGKLKYTIMEGLDTDFYIYPKTIYKQYDGSYASCTDTTDNINGITELLNLGYTYECSISGGGSSPGLYYTTITSFKLYNESGLDVTSYYNLTFAKGKIYVYEAEITITRPSLTKDVYDGDALYTYDYTISEGSLMTGHRLEIVEVEILNKVSSITNSFEFVILDESNEDVTNLYRINKNYGTLTISNRAKVMITLLDLEKDYDGKAVNKVEYEVTGLNSAYTITFNQQILKDGLVISNASGVGAYFVTVDVSSVVIKNSLGVDVTSNYIVEHEDADIFIYPA